MKTSSNVTISVNNSDLRKWDDMAKQLSMTRSEILAVAMAEFSKSTFAKYSKMPSAQLAEIRQKRKDENNNE